MEWIDEFITNAPHEMTAMVRDWKYDDGVEGTAYVAVLLWIGSSCKAGDVAIRTTTNPSKFLERI